MDVDVTDDPERVAFNGTDPDVPGEERRRENRWFDYFEQGSILIGICSPVSEWPQEYLIREEAKGFTVAHMRRATGSHLRAQTSTGRAEPQIRAGITPRV
jgi:hypothetical protein